MSTELATLQGVMNNQIEGQTTSPATLVEVSSSDWVPMLTIGYAISDVVAKGIAKPGEFILSNRSSLGSKIEVICFDYRVHAVVMDKDKQSSESEIFVGSDWKQSLQLHPQYAAFIAQKIEGNKELQEGADLFMYVPSVNSFVGFYCKKTLAKFADPIFRASRGGLLVELTTLLRVNKTGNRKWYDIDIKPTQRAVVGSSLPGVTADIGIEEGMFMKYFKMFKEPKAGPEIVSAAEAGPSRDR